MDEDTAAGDEEFAVGEVDDGEVDDRFNGGVEDKHLRKFFMERNTLNVSALRASKIFTKLYMINPKEYVLIDNEKYEKRGYILCKGHRKHCWYPT